MTETTTLTLLSSRWVRTAVVTFMIVWSACCVTWMTLDSLHQHRHRQHEHARRMETTSEATTTTTMTSLLKRIGSSNFRPPQGEQQKRQLSSSSSSSSSLVFASSPSQEEIERQAAENAMLKKEKALWLEKQLELQLELQELENAALKKEKLSWGQQEEALQRELEALEAEVQRQREAAAAAAAAQQQQQQQQQSAPAPRPTKQHQLPQFLDVPLRAADQVLPPAVVETTTNGLPPCRISVENRFHFHLEVVESAATLHPLPWDEWRRRGACDTSLPAIVDLALGPREGRFHYENPSFEGYFYDQLQNRVFVRQADNHAIRYGQFVEYQNYKHKYDAVIGLSCTESSEEWVEEWLRESPSHLCILHRQFYIPPDLYDQTCFVHPAWLQAGRCMYLPTVFPRFPPPPPVTPDSDVTLCVVGARRAHHVLAAALEKLLPRLSESVQSRFRVNLLMRAFEGGAKTIRRDYQRKKVDHLIKTTLGADFLRHEKIVGSECHGIMPLVDPKKNKMYFESPAKALIPVKPGEVTEMTATQRLSGSITKAMGYKLPVIIHRDLEKIYRGYWTAPVYTYKSVAEFADVLYQFLQDSGAIAAAKQ